MKVNKQTIVNFLKKVNMSGDLNEAIFDFTETGLKISGKNPAGVTRIDAILKSSAFIEYNAAGKIGVQEINNIVRILSGFNKEVDIIIEGNLLTLKEASKKVSIELLDTQFIEEVQDLPDLKFTEKIKMSSKDVNDFIKDASINKDFFLKISTKEKVTMLSNSGKFKFAKTFETPESKGDVTVKFGEHFVNAFLNLTNDVTLDMANDYPVKIIESMEHSIVSIITAPVSGDDDGDNVASGDQVENTVKGSDEDITVLPEVEQTE